MDKYNDNKQDPGLQSLILEAGREYVIQVETPGCRLTQFLTLRILKDTFLIILREVTRSINF